MFHTCINVIMLEFQLGYNYLNFFCEIKILKTILNDKCSPSNRMLRTELVLSIEHQLWFLLPAAH